MDDLLALLPLITVFFIFYVILYIPQRRRQKKHKIYIDSLTIGDQVITDSGIHGRVVNIKEETVTLVIKKETAQLNKLSYEGVFRCISLELISSLSSVGLTAKISKLLSDNGISANICAGYYHDHIFVPQDRSEEALKLLCDNV